jgi:carbon-monoxide dehydrogenase large subunit
MPYRTPVGTTYDSGDFAQLFEDALERADVAHFKARAEQSEKAGRRRGLGVGCFLEIAGGQQGEGAAIEFPGQSRLLLSIGVQASGQGHRTLYRRLVAERLGIPADRVAVEQGDSDDGVPSAGAVASRSTMSVGGAVAAATDAVIERGRRVAAHVLEAAEADILYRDGVFEIAGTDRRVGLFELADRARALAAAGEVPESLDTRRTADVPPTFPNGVHVAEIEVEPDTGRLTLTRYTAVDDCGRVLQPVLVEGQVLGGVAQGVGEAGTTASLAAIMNAVSDALPECPEIDMPATPERVWRALHGL